MYIRIHILWVFPLKETRTCTDNVLYIGHNVQGVIQDFKVEGGNEKSNQKMLLKKGQLLFQYSAMDTQS